MLNKSKPARPARGLVLTFYTVFLLWVATRPQAELPWAEMYWDKARHAGAFFVLTLLGLWSLGFARFSRSQRAVRSLGAALYALVIGALIETLQTQIPGRFADPRDFAADATGVVAAILTAWTILRWKEHAKPTPHGSHPPSV